MKTLILGGMRSGKSACAMRLAQEFERAARGNVVHIATARALDDEMRERIARHRADRPVAWRSVESPEALGAAITAESRSGCCVIVDCLTLWLTNFIAPMPQHAAIADRYPAERAALIAAVRAAPGELLLVGNEVGQGAIPADMLSRRFIDEAGWLYQALAAQCDRVLWVVAGCALAVKGTP